LKNHLRESLEGYEMGVEYHPPREVEGDLYDFEWNSRNQC